jgi:sec-independent protein translocase protein TatC
VTEAPHDPRRDPRHAGGGSDRGGDPDPGGQVPLSPHLDPRAPRRAPLAEDDARRTGEMPFLQHLEELRQVLFHAAVGCVAGAMGGWWLAPVVLEHLIHRTVGEAFVLSPMEAFNERIKLTLLLGLVLSAPYVFWRVWNFIVPGLLKRERTWVLPMALGSMLLFAGGVAAAYFYIVPLVVNVLSGFMTPSMSAQIRVEALLGMTYGMALGCGIVCQLPLVLMTLTAVRLTTPRGLLRGWRYAVVGSFVVTAAITPGDVVTAQIVLAVPMVLLYFLSVGLSWLVWRRQRAAEAADEA